MGDQHGSGDTPPLKTYSLQEVADMVLPPDIKDGVGWLSRRLKRNEIRGYKAGRVWRMTEEDVRHLVEHYRNDAPIPRPQNPPGTPIDRDFVADLRSLPSARSRRLRGM